MNQFELGGTTYTFKKPVIKILKQVKALGFENPAQETYEALVEGKEEAVKNWNEYLDAVLEGTERPVLESLTLGEVVFIIAGFTTLASEIPKPLKNGKETSQASGEKAK